jgi:hypothetical protein
MHQKYSKKKGNSIIVPWIMVATAIKIYKSVQYAS